jgi:hypothetical protein
METASARRLGFVGLGQQVDRRGAAWRRLGVSPPPSEESSRLAVRGQQGNRLLVKGNEGFAA